MTIKLFQRRETVRRPPTPLARRQQVPFSGANPQQTRDTKTAERKIKLRMADAPKGGHRAPRSPALGTGCLPEARG